MIEYVSSGEPRDRSAGTPYGILPADGRTCAGLSQALLGVTSVGVSAYNYLLAW